MSLHAAERRVGVLIGDGGKHALMHAYDFAMHLARN